MRTVWRPMGVMDHRIDSPAAVRYSVVFPAFEADAMTAMIEHDSWAEIALPGSHTTELLPRISWATSTVGLGGPSPSKKWTVSWRGC